MKSDLARRIERQDMHEWDRQYRHLLGPIRKTDDCTCDWISEQAICQPEPEWIHVALDKDCPDHVWRMTQ